MLNVVVELVGIVQVVYINLNLDFVQDVVLVIVVDCKEIVFFYGLSRGEKYIFDDEDDDDILYSVL